MSEHPFIENKGGALGAPPPPDKKRGMIKKPSFLFSGIIIVLGLIYWKDYFFEIVLCFYLGQKEKFEYKNC